MNVVEKKYNGTCTVYEYTATTDANNITSNSEKVLYTDQPCRMVVESNPNAADARIPSLSQTITLLCSPSLAIAPGSRIVVTQEGRTEGFKAAGIAAVYTTHQEITLITEKEYA